MSSVTVRAIRKQIKKQNKARSPWVGLVGDAHGMIEVPGQPTLWYVRPKGTDLPLIVRGGSAPRVAGTEVLVGQDPYRRKLTRVLGLHYSDGGGATHGVEAHAESHGLDGSDPVYLSTRQITNGLVYAAGGIVAGVHPGWVIVGGKPVKITAASLDLTSHIPVSGALWALIRADDTGVLDVQDGTPVASLADLTTADAPTAPQDYAPLALVRLYAGQTSLRRTTTSPDLIDVRFAPRTVGGGGATALDDLADVDAAAPGDGQVLTWDDTAGEWVAADATGAALTIEEIDGTPSVSGVTKIRVPNGRLADDGGGVVSLALGGVEIGEGAYNRWDPFAPPASPSAQDDEFDDGTVSGWTETDPNSISTVTEGDGSLILTNATRAGISIAGVYKAIPAGDFTITTHMALSGRNSSSLEAGIALWENAVSPTTTGIYSCQMTIPEGQVRAQRWTNANTFQGTLANSAQFQYSSIWLRITRTGTTYEFLASDDGLSWMRLYSGTLVFVPAHFGLFLNNNNTGADARSRFHCFRYQASAAAVTDRTNGQLVTQGSRPDIIKATKSAISAMTPTAGTLAYATDTNELAVGNGSAWVWFGTAPSFLGLGDTPDSYTGQESKLVRVNSGATALEFATPADLLREKLTGNRTYYVRTNGSDSNSGLVDAAGGAFLTIQKAVDVVSQLDINSYTVTIQVADGTYTGATTLKNVAGYSGPGTLIIRGNTTTPANCVISTTSAPCFQGVALYCAWSIQGFKLQTTTAGACVLANKGSYIGLSDINFGACAGQHMYASRGGIIDVSTNYTISGGALYHLLANFGGRIECASMTVTVAANVSITYFAAATYLATLLANAMTFSLGGFTVTGTRYLVQASAVIYTNSGGASYFPGTLAGSVATNGQYL